MSGPTLVVFVGVLSALLLVMIAMLVWQEGRKRSFETAPSYVVGDVVKHVTHRLAEDVASRLGTEGVERIIEWEIRYLLRDGGPGAIAGGTQESVAYVVDNIEKFTGESYEPADVRAVLMLEVEYLATIGVVGDAVAQGEEPFRDQRPIDPT